MHSRLPLLPGWPAMWQCMLQAGLRVWQNIKSGVAEQHPNCLCLFVLLSYADLKKFVYWSW